MQLLQKSGKMGACGMILLLCSFSLSSSTALAERQDEKDNESRILGELS